MRLLRVRTILANQWMRLRYGVFEDPDPRRTGLRDIVELSLFMEPYVRLSVHRDLSILTSNS